MNEKNDIREQYSKLQEVMHVVSQIEKLRLNIDNKLQNKRYPSQEVLDVLADAIAAIDETTRIHPRNGRWVQICDALRRGEIVEGLCDEISIWQRETLNWVDHMESRRLIQELQEEVHRQAEEISRLKVLIVSDKK